MERRLEDIYIKIESEGLFDKNKTLYIFDIPNEKILKNIPISPQNDEVFVFAKGFNNDLKIECKFEVLFQSQNPYSYIECKVELKYVSVNPKYKVEYLPKGYTGICLLKFQNVLPIELLIKLAKYGEKKDIQKHDTLILTQKKAFNSLLREIEIITPNSE